MPPKNEPPTTSKAVPPKGKPAATKNKPNPLESKFVPGKSKPIPIPKTVLSEKDKEEINEQEQESEMKKICDEAAWRFVCYMRYPKKK